MLFGKVAGDDQCRWDQVHLVLLAADGQVRRFFDLLFLVLDDPARFGGLDPAVGGDQVHVVLHRLRPIVHQSLVDVVAAEQRQVTEVREQVFG